MRLSELWRTTTFRLTAFYGLAFAVGIVTLLGMVYLQSAVYLTRRVDTILNVEADALSRDRPAEISRRIGEALAFSGGQTSILALFTPSGERLAGNLSAPPAGLAEGGRPIEIPPSGRFRTYARVIARRLPTGEELVVGRDVSQLRAMRGIIASALVWSGLCIIILGLGSGIAVSLTPLRRLRALQAAGQEIAAGDLRRRMPISSRHDELDMFAATVNYMMGEVERLMGEVKGASDTIAHDLRTPLTRARAQLHRLQHAATPDPEEIGRVVAEIDEVLERFRALLRISELEARERQMGFFSTDLGDLVGRVVELYQPLAEAEGVRLSLAGGACARVEADPKLLFEAVSNLVDNAIKFTGAGGTVKVRLDQAAGWPQVVVEDDGPGIPPAERSAALQRFYRGERDRQVRGSGLGLSIVAAIVRLHRFELRLNDAAPGLRAIIECRPPTLKF